MIPGLINAHQHLTGDRLVRSTIPDDIDVAGRHLPVGGADPRRPHGRRRRAVGHARARRGGRPTASRSPSRRAPSPTPTGCSPAYDARRRRRHARVVGVGRRRGAVRRDRSTRCSTASGPCSTLRAGHPRVHGWVTLVGHDLMSRRARGRAASALAREAGTQHHVPPLARRRRRRRLPRADRATGRLSTSTSSARSAATCCWPTPSTSTTPRSTSCCDRDVGDRLLPVGLPAARPGRRPAPAATPRSSPPAAASPSAATPRTPATHVDVLRAAQAAAGIALDAGRRPVRRPHRAGAGHDRRRRGDRHGPRARLARGGQAGRRRRASTRPGRTG